MRLSPSRSIARTLSGWLRARGAAQRLPEPVVPGAAIGQARELVVRRGRLELGQQPLPLALEPEPLLALEADDHAHAEERDGARAVADQPERHVLEHGPAGRAEQRPGGREQPAAQAALGREQADRDHVEEADRLDRVRDREPQQRDEDEQQRAHREIGALGPRDDVGQQPSELFRRATRAA